MIPIYFAVKYTFIFHWTWIHFAAMQCSLLICSAALPSAPEFCFCKSESTFIKVKVKVQVNAVLSSCLVAGGSLPGVIPVTTKALWPQHQPTNTKYKNVYNCFVFISCPLSFILYHPAFWPQHLPTNIKYKMLTFWVESCCLLYKYQLAFWC